MNHRIVLPALASLATVAVVGAAVAQAAPASGSRAVDRAIAAARQHGPAMGLDADQALTVRSSSVDRDGTTHVRLDRTFKGLPITGGDVVIHTDAQGAWKGVTAAATSVRVASTSPTVSAPTAAARAAAAVDFSVSTSTPQLSVYALSGAPRLAWKVSVDGTGAQREPAGELVFVDARSGAVIDQWATVQTDVGSGQSLYLGTVSIDTTAQGGQWAMIDSVRGNARTEDANNGSTSTTSGTLFTDADNAWGTGSNANRQTAAVDADFGVARTWDFYKTTYGRSGIRNDGVAAKSLVHVGQNWVNASWSDTCFCMRYGDGDGVSYTPLVSLDVAGHEMTHGVTSTTAGLAYRRESGGLNESTSDVMGTMVEFSANNAADPGDYLIGETISVTHKPLRWMDKPSKDGRSADCWSKTVGSLDVHYSSGVGNHAFYLLSEGTGTKTIGGVTHSSTTCNGTTLTGIGHDKAAAIWYRALSTYWVSNTNYAGARSGMVQAAADLYGAASVEANATAAAWAGVNVK